MLMKTSSLGGELEISGAIVKRQQSKRKGADAEEDENSEEEEIAPKKKRRKGEKAAAPAPPPITPADAAKDTAEKFEYLLRKAIEDAQQQNPGKVIVVIADGGGPHTCEPFISLRPSQRSTDEIEAELRAAGLWPKKGLNVTEAKRKYTDSPIPRSQWTNAELIALELGAILLYIPLNHPQLNVIEQNWRGVKQHYRLNCKKNLKQMMKCARDALTGAEGAEDVCGVAAIKRRKLRTSLIARHLAANPDADALSENKLRGKTFKPSPEVDVSNVPDFGGTLRVPENLLHAQLYAHYGNQARLKQFRRGQVIIRVCYRFCIYSCV